MKIVIDIPEAQYKNMKIIAGLQHYRDELTIEQIIAAGEPLSIEDCVSREAVTNCFKKWQPCMATRLGEFEEELTALPSIPPKQKIGHWIYDEARSDWFDATYECSCCKRSITVPYELTDVPYETLNEVYKDYPYCHCGARMIDPQEGEE